MANDKSWQRTLRYEPESWRDDDASRRDPKLSPEDEDFIGYARNKFRHSEPDVRDQTSVLELLGRINYKIIKGGRVYIEAGGVVYKTLYGGYWRSVFTGVEHYLFRCEQVSNAVWAEEDCADTAVDLPIAFSNDGWAASGHSLSFILSREQTADGKQQSARARLRRWTLHLGLWNSLKLSRYRSRFFVDPL